GMAALGSLLSGTTEGGLIWRITFILAGMLGLFESVTFLRAPGRPMSRTGRTLILLGMVHVWLAYAELKQEEQAVTGSETQGGR
ncbi:MAG: hypothetical protein ACRDTJ_09060, partial [Pseudonocardiaceae bacterium]